MQLTLADRKSLLYMVWLNILIFVTRFTCTLLLGRTDRTWFQLHGGTLSSNLNGVKFAKLKLHNIFVSSNLNDFAFCLNTSTVEDTLSCMCQNLQNGRHTIVWIVQFQSFCKFNF